MHIHTMWVLTLHCQHSHLTLTAPNPLPHPSAEMNMSTLIWVMNMIYCTNYYKRAAKSVMMSAELTVAFSTFFSEMK